MRHLLLSGVLLEAHPVLHHIHRFWQDLRPLNPDREMAQELGDFLGLVGVLAPHHENGWITKIIHGNRTIIKRSGIGATLENRGDRR